MDLTAFRTLVKRWEEEAALLRRRGAPRQADALESAAEELEDQLRSWTLEPLTIAKAAAESGYSERRLRELLSEGTLPNAGKAGGPRIHRKDLPAKPGSDGPTLDVADGAASVAEKALRKRRQ